MPTQIKVGPPFESGRTATGVPHAVVAASDAWLRQEVVTWRVFKRVAGSWLADEATV